MRKSMNTKITEIWKDIPGWEDAYQISNIGRVWSKRFNKPCAIRPNTGNKYLIVDLFTRRKGVVRKKRFYIHRLVATCFIPNPENKQYVDHIDGDKTNNIYTNLQWVTNSENVQKGYDKENANKNKRFQKQAVYITTEPRVYFDSMTECAKALGLPRERIKTVLRFFNGRLPELGIQVIRCDTSAVTTSRNDVALSEAKCSTSLSDKPEDIV